MKNTFLQSPVIALQHIKNSAWAIEKLYSKTCVRTLFTRYLHYNCESHASTIFTPRYLDEIQGSNKHSSSQFHPTGLQSGEDKSFQLHIGRKKKGEFWEYFQNRSRVLWATLRPFMTFENQNMAALNLTFIRRNTRVFAFVSNAHISSRRRSWAFEFGGIYPHYIKWEQLEYFEILPT